MSNCRTEDEEKHGGHSHSHGHGHGGHGHSHSHNDAQHQKDHGGESLYPYIDKDKVSCLNEREDGMAKAVFKPWQKRLEELPRLESEEDDPELLIRVSFTSAVRLRTFCMIGGGNGTAPSKLKFFINKENIDFEEAQAMKATQEFEVAEDFKGEVNYPVIASRFNNVSSLTIYVQDVSGLYCGYFIFCFF